MKNSKRNIEDTIQVTTWKNLDESAPNWRCGRQYYLVQTTATSGVLKVIATPDELLIRFSPLEYECYPEGITVKLVLPCDLVTEVHYNLLRSMLNSINEGMAENARLGEIPPLLAYINILQLISGYDADLALQTVDVLRVNSDEIDVTQEQLQAIDQLRTKIDSAPESSVSGMSFILTNKKQRSEFSQLDS